MKVVKVKSTEYFTAKTLNSSLLLSKREWWQKGAAHAKSLSLYFGPKFTSLYQTAHCGAITLNLIQQIFSIKLLLGLTLSNNEEDVEILKWNGFFYWLNKNHRQVGTYPSYHPGHVTSVWLMQLSILNLKIFNSYKKKKKDCLASPIWCVYVAVEKNITQCIEFFPVIITPLL